MKNVNLNLPPVGGKKLQLKVKTTINYDDLEKKKSNRKAFKSRPVFLWFRRICITLCRWKETLFLRGVTTTRFQLGCYEEELGKPYSEIFFICVVPANLLMSVVALFKLIRTQSCLCREFLPIILMKFMKVKCLPPLMIKNKNLIYL